MRRATMMSTRPLRFFVSVASKGVMSTVEVDPPRVRFVGAGSFEAPFVPQGKHGKHAVPAFSAASVCFVGAQFIAPISPRPLPKRRCLMPMHLPKRAPKP
jgi:hypothetical protein